jgi:hypothetical protein
MYVSLSIQRTYLHVILIFHPLIRNKRKERKIFSIIKLLKDYFQTREILVFFYMNKRKYKQSNKDYLNFSRN